ncbi:hypothetical protein TSOC_000064 [Tetrabaena socialis]|uniref:Uncharacterized protein n=1 Tax=Tetrabaena socialis TaxID=47790 RepID=A0A2J8AKB0_9CHLO|nr:hypothetical protein TSOC_000064 [Tetrabaena socialis]|eukprot:PNH12950.1 hypothetical protein TSOC_000064 [Tetrabaena socialis]
MYVSYAAPEHSDNSPPPLPPRLHNVSYTDLMRWNVGLVLQRDQRFEPIPVFWLDRLVGAVAGMSGDLDAQYNTWRQRCKALNYYNLPEDARREW